MARQRRACDTCYKRKIQCDAADEGSQCNWCSHHNLRCTFTRPKARPRSRTLSRAGPRQRLALADGNGPASLLSSASRSPDPAPARPPNPRRAVDPPRPSHPRGRHVNAALGLIYISGHNFGRFYSASGFPQFTAEGEEWIRSRTGQWPSLPGLSAAAAAAAAPESASPSLLAHRHPPGCAARLPDRLLVETLLKAFVASDLIRVFPLLDGVLFLQIINQAYGSEQQPPRAIERHSAKACVFALLSLMDPRYFAIPGGMPLDGNACAAEAQALLSDVLEDSSVTALQTLLMLLVYETFSGRLQAASMYHAAACRALFALDAHIIVSEPAEEGELSLQDREARLLRVLFWVCFIFDKDIALRTGQPPIINDEFCDLTLPWRADSSRFTNPGRDGEASSSSSSVSSSSASASASADVMKAPWYHGDLQLTLLKSKACRLLYSATSLRQPNAALLRTIRELDEELEEWRLTIPAEFSPSLFVSKHPRLAADLDTSRSMVHIELHLNYHYLMNIIHAASGRCVVDGSDPERAETFGVQSSLELSVEASRSTLIYLSAAAGRLVSEAFWVFSFYPMSALVSLFFNILRYPSQEQATQDVELLGSASEVIRRMPHNRSLTARETAYLKRIDDFTAELYRLGLCAIAQARDEAAERARAAQLDSSRLG
ncbi:hypothetical protein CDD83_8223 [Cordyceps sp. RAO-2017]|nr:hypothetical protein CDD83_8223 [Cordyceps sp. RAO-2017]